MRLPRFSGNLSQFEHPERSRQSSKFKLKMVLGRHRRFLQSLSLYKVRAVRPSVDDCSSFYVVLLTATFLRPFRFPRFSGKLSQFEHPERSRHSSWFKLQMVLGRHLRFLQSSKIRKVRVVKPSIDDGSSLIVVPLKKSILRPLKFPKFNGKLSQFEHPRRSRHSSNFKEQMVLGRHIRFFLSLSVRNVRTVKPSINDGSSFVLLPLK